MRLPTLLSTVTVATVPLSTGAAARSRPRCAELSALRRPLMTSMIVNQSGSDLRRRLIAVYTILVAGNLLTCLWALVALDARPVLLGTALLAYTFGLRHAVAADHIAAIDNVTRNLMHQGQRPVAV